jgi:predicted transcriptional regulator
LAHVAGRVFLDLANELAAQGVGRKVSADMFGMALRSYVRKVRRLHASVTEPERTLWQAVYDAIADAPDGVTRDELLRRFARDDDAQVNALLRDLSDSGLVCSEGRAGTQRYRTAASLNHAPTGNGFEELVWVTISREGPLGWSELCARVGRDEPRLERAVQALIEMGRVHRSGTASAPRFEARDFLIPLDATSGWEAAVFDHFQAVVQTICQRLTVKHGGARTPELVGGSTYRFDVWPGHPMWDEARQCLSKFRAEHTALRERVDAYNREHTPPSEYTQVVLYGGQCLVTRDGDTDEGREDADA